MGRYQPFSRRELRRRFRSWIGRNRTAVVLLTVGMVALLAFEAVLLMVLVPPSTVGFWLLGVVQATTLLGYVMLLCTTFLAHDVEAIRHLRGAWGEDNTREELQRAKRRRLVWGWVDSITLQSGDLDHLVVTRHGGLVAVDSKWRNRASDTVDMAKAAQRARLRAEGLARTLLAHEPGARHRARLNPLPVTPVVVLWGAAQHNVPDHARVDGIDFVAGRNLLTWLGRLNGEPVSKAAASDLIDRLERFRAKTWGTTAAP